MELKVTTRALIQQRVRARRTFRYTVKGLMGLLAITTIAGVLVVGNNAGARDAMRGALGLSIDELPGSTRAVQANQLQVSSAPVASVSLPR